MASQSDNATIFRMRRPWSADTWMMPEDGSIADLLRTARPPNQDESMVYYLNSSGKLSLESYLTPPEKSTPEKKDQSCVVMLHYSPEDGICTSKENLLGLIQKWDIPHAAIEILIPNMSEEWSPAHRPIPQRYRDFKGRMWYICPFQSSSSGKIFSYHQTQLSFLFCHHPMRDTTDELAKPFQVLAVVSNYVEDKRHNQACLTAGINYFRQQPAMHNLPSHAQMIFFIVAVLQFNYMSMLIRFNDTLDHAQVIVSSAVFLNCGANSRD